MSTIPASLYHHGTVVNQDADAGHLVITEGANGLVRQGRTSSDRGRRRDMEAGGVCPTLNDFDNGTESRATVIAFGHTQGLDPQASESATPTLRKEGGGAGVSAAAQVRRLTPRECERLQGFPDGWSDGQADSARYRQMGNAVAVPVVEWIMRRLVEVDADA